MRAHSCRGAKPLTGVGDGREAATRALAHTPQPSICDAACHAACFVRNLSLTYDANFGILYYDVRCVRNTTGQQEQLGVATYCVLLLVTVLRIAIGIAYCYWGLVSL